MFGAGHGRFQFLMYSCSLCCKVTGRVGTRGLTMGVGKPIGPIPIDGFHWGDGRAVELAGGIPPGDHVEADGIMLCVGVSGVDVVEGNHRAGVVVGDVVAVVGSGGGCHLGKRGVGHVVAVVGHGGSCQCAGVVMGRGVGRIGNGMGCHCGVATDRGVPDVGVGIMVEGAHRGGPPEVPPGAVDVGSGVDGPVFNGRELSMCRTWSIG